MSLIIEIQQASAANNIPHDEQLELWLNAAVQEQFKTHELCLRIVDIAEITELNSLYRQKDQATNVLSFPADLPEGVNIPLLGDIVICAPVVEKEATEQNKTLTAHWAHMCVHGILHLQGYDHIDDTEAEIMENLEIQIMQSLGFDSPYAVEETH